jgi:hypothetical protein
LSSIDIKFFTRKVGDILVDHKTHEEILEALKVEPVDEKLRRKGYKESINFFFVMEG